MNRGCIVDTCPGSRRTSLLSISIPTNQFSRDGARTLAIDAQQCRLSTDTNKSVFTDETVSTDIQHWSAAVWMVNWIILVIVKFHCDTHFCTPAMTTRIRLTDGNHRRANHQPHDNCQTLTSLLSPPPFQSNPNATQRGEPLSHQMPSAIRAHFAT